MTRYARIASTSPSIASYLPANYEIVEVKQTIDGKEWTIIKGEDKAGWTLDDYVLPRLASGLFIGKETCPSHPESPIVDTVLRHCEYCHDMYLDAKHGG